MDVPCGPERLGVVVSPRLLRDTLTRALRASGVEVVVADDASELVGELDLVIVSEFGEVSAPVVVRVPHDDEHGIGAVCRDGGPPQLVALPDVDSIVALCTRGATRP